MATLKDILTSPERLEAEMKAEVRQRLRDQFAAAALTGLLAGFQNGKSCDSYAQEAYEVADAMLRARQQEVPTDG
jgi:hypothetical protein